MSAQITVIGSVGRDPEIKLIAGKNGEFKVAEFSLADSQSELKNGEWQDGLTLWYKISATGRLADTVENSVHKGQRLVISGQFKVTEYQAKDGSTKTIYEIKASSISEALSAKNKTKSVVENSFDGQWETSWNS